MNKKILILYTSIGMGHKYIAQNIAHHLEQAGNTVLLHDILKVQEGMLSDVGTWLHSFVNRNLPFIWRWLYFSNLINSIGLPLRVKLAKSNSENLNAIVQEFNPDIILSTQTTGSAATAALIQKGQFTGKFVIAFSDYHLHRFWIYDEADLFLVNIKEQKDEMIGLGVAPEKIVVCGVTLRPLVPTSQDELKQRLNIPAQDKVMIFGSGSLGIGFDQNTLLEFLALADKERDMTTIVLCGKNESLLKLLLSQQYKKVLPFGFYDNPSELYQIADLLVSKPGGLTVAEALQAECRILVTHTLPGQEEPNYEYLLERQLIYPKPDPLTPMNLFNTAMAKLSSDNRSDQTEAQKITQKGHEGKLLIKAMENLFHNV